MGSSLLLSCNHYRFGFSVVSLWNLGDGVTFSVDKGAKAVDDAIESLGAFANPHLHFLTDEKPSICVAFNPSLDEFRSINDNSDLKCGEP